MMNKGLTKLLGLGSRLALQVQDNGEVEKVDEFKELKDSDGLVCQTANSVAISLDEALFCLGGGLSSSSYGMLRVYSMEDRKMLLARKVGKGNSIYHVEFGSSGTRLFIGAKAVYIWDSSSKPKDWVCMKTLVGHTASVSSLFESPCERYLASSSYDNTVRIWDTDTGAKLRTIKEHEDSVTGKESKKLMEELGVAVEELEPKPTDAESKNKALKDLEEKREEEIASLEKEVERLWKMLEVGKDGKKAFKEKLEAAGKIKQAGQAMLKEEAGPLWDKESEELMEELGVTVEELDPKPTDAESKNKAAKKLLSDVHEKERQALLKGWKDLNVG